MTRYAIGMGSNMGDRLSHLVEASMALGVDRSLVSSIYETEPVGGPEQDPFLNAVAIVESDLTPLEMLDLLQQVEHDHGRVRLERWGPRTLDLDLLTSDGETHDDERLTLPHPRCAEREFALRPLAEVWPEADVGNGVTADVALDGLEAQRVDWLAHEWLPPVAKTRERLLVGVQFASFVAIALVVAVDGHLPEGEVTVLGVVGAVAAVAGMILAFISSRRLGPALTPSPVPKQGSTLVTGGPYRYARHPIYGGVTLVLMGTALFLDSVWGFAGAALLIPFFWMKTSYEERQLRMRFAGYRAYRQVVHRRLLPFLI